ncbi:prostasin-like [Macrobrachium nipponense]|uniref:prostasin-like n=1 Tax=Macrobrachium nipponense TaxID=159736 RepID=UPI0030C8BD61
MAFLNITTEDQHIRFSCGGSILSRDTIISAAHCFSSYTVGPLSSVDAVVGVSDIFSHSASVHSVSQIKIHENFSSSTLENDIAILTLAAPLTFNAYVQPVCLGTDAMIFPKRKIETMGWGFDGSEGDMPDKLQHVTLDIYNPETCKNVYSEYVQDKNFCTLTPGKDACIGDSGGPMVVEKENKWYQLGIISFGEGCAAPDKPNVAASIPYFKSWIFDNMVKIQC